MDGILVGLSVATLGRTQGVLLTIALTLAVLPLALSVTVELSHHGAGTVQVPLVPPLLSPALAAGAIGAVILLAAAPAALLAGILAFGLAVLLTCRFHETLGDTGGDARKCLSCKGKWACRGSRIPEQGGTP